MIFYAMCLTIFVYAPLAVIGILAIVMLTYEIARLFWALLTGQELCVERVKK